MMRRRLALFLAADLSLAAAVAHALVAPEHFGEAVEYGAAFVAMAMAQLIFVGLVLAYPTRNVFLLGIAGNAAILLLYLYTRVVGIPLGPAAGEIEAIGLIDVPSKLAEVALIGVLVWLARGGGAPEPLSRVDGDEAVVPGPL